MTDLNTSLFLLNLALLFTHELDAIQRHEWRVLPPFSSLNDRLGYQLFVAFHVPLFVLFIWLTPNTTFQIAIDSFLIIHAGLHWLFRNHPHYEFDNFFSKIWIVTPMLTGAVHLLFILLM